MTVGPAGIHGGAANSGDHAGLAATLAEVMQADIRGIQRLKGGYSRRMWAFDTVSGDGSAAPWILCTDSPHGVVGADSLDRVREARLIDHARRGAIPAPAVIASGSAAGGVDLGGDWFVMERLEGTASVGPLVARSPPHRPARTIGRAEGNDSGPDSRAGHT